MSKLLNIVPTFVSRSIIAGFFKFQAWRTVGYRGTHSLTKIIKMTAFSVKILPALQDNYMYLIIDNETKDAAIVDPVDPDSVLAAVQEHAVNLKSVLTTHHHWDHAGGNGKLVSKATAAGLSLNVYGGDDRIDALTTKIAQDDVITLGGLSVRCLFTPCHTTGHICYYIEASNGDRAVFTGDTLFLGGCGRFFEGTASQMHDALIGKLSQLPDDTNVYCGHEYTLQNLAFGAHVEPNNADIANKIKWAEQQRETTLPTVPSTIGEEKLINPFMRVNVPTVQAHTKQTDAIATMDALRKEKNSFRG